MTIRPRPEIETLRARIESRLQARAPGAGLSILPPLKTLPGSDDGQDDLELSLIELDRMLEEPR